MEPRVATILTNAYEETGGKQRDLAWTIGYAFSITHPHHTMPVDLLRAIGIERVNLGHYESLPNHFEAHLYNGQPKLVAPVVKRLIGGDIPQDIGDAMMLAYWGEQMSPTLNPGDNRRVLGLQADVANAHNNSQTSFYSPNLEAQSVEFEHIVQYLMVHRLERLKKPVEELLHRANNTEDNVWLHNPHQAVARLTPEIFETYLPNSFSGPGYDRSPEIDGGVTMRQL